MPTHRNIEIRFLRRKEGTTNTADNNPAHDDVLRIVKLGENSVRIIYLEREGDGTMTDTLTLSYQEALTHIYKIFMLMGLDADPFVSVQFRIPGYPCYLILVEKIQENMSMIMGILASSCWGWAHVGTPPPGA